MTKLICINDPAGITGREIVDFPAGMSATEMLMQHFPDGIDKDNCSIYINDIATVVGESPWLFQPLGEDDVVLFRNEPKAVASIVYYAIVAVVAAIAVVALTPKPSIPNGLGSTKQSPNNTLQGQTNIARPYQGLPDIYGNPKCYPDLGGEPLIYYENNKKYVEQFFCVGIGEYEIPPLFAGTTPLLNFEGAEQEVTLPTNKSTTYTAAVTAYTQNSGNNYNLEVTGQSFNNFAINSEIVLANFFITPIVSGDDLDLSGRYTITDAYSVDIGGTIYHRMTLLKPDQVNDNWRALEEDRGGEGDSTFSTPTFSTANPEAIATNLYSFAINEVDGQEIIAANQGGQGISATATSLVTDISYTEGSNFTFSVLSDTDWDALKSDFDASAVDYYVEVKYEYSKRVSIFAYELTEYTGRGKILSMTLVPDVGGDYYDVVIEGFDGLSSEGGSPSYGQNVTITESIGEIIGPFVTPIECEYLRFNIIFPRGLKWTNVFQITTNQVDEFGVIIPGTESVYEFDIGANTLDQQFRTIDIQPGIGFAYYSTSIRRIDYSANKADKPDLAQLESLSCLFIDSARNFGNVTLLKTKLPATINATSLRENQINLKATRKTISYNTTTRQVDYNLTASKRFADALLHEYVIVFKRDPSELDLDSLYEIQERIDAVNHELGEFVYTFDDLDISLDKRMDVILNAARCFKWLDGDVYRFGRDEKKEFIENVITQRDIASPQERDYSLQYLSTMPSDYDSIKLQYVDANTNKKAYIYRKIENRRYYD
jgi:hypothetical protein